MAKYCPNCGQPSDDSARVCTACGSPFQNTYPTDDEPVTVVADDVDYRPTQQEPVSQPAQPAYQPPSDTAYRPTQSAYQPPSDTAYRPTQSAYQPPSDTTYQPTQSAYQPTQAAYQPRPAQPETPRNYARPLNMAQPNYATPLQQQSIPEKKNKGMVLGIVITVAIVLVIAAIVVTIIVVSNNASRSSDSGFGGSGTGSAASLQGSYYLNSQNDHGITLSRQDIQQYSGGDMTLTIGSNNSGTISAADGSSVPVTFDTSTHTVSVTGMSEGTYTLNGNTLTLTLEEGTVIDEFVRQ